MAFLRYFRCLFMKSVSCRQKILADVQRKVGGQFYAVYPLVNKHSY